MVSLLSSKFETYLLDEENELECSNNTKENQETKVYETKTYDEYPPGFFTSL